MLNSRADAQDPRVVAGSLRNRRATASPGQRRRGRRLWEQRPTPVQPREPFRRATRKQMTLCPSFAFFLKFFHPRLGKSFPLMHWPPTSASIQPRTGTPLVFVSQGYNPRASYKSGLLCSPLFFSLLPVFTFVATGFFGGTSRAQAGLWCSFLFPFQPARVK